MRTPPDLRPFLPAKSFPRTKKKVPESRAMPALRAPILNSVLRIPNVWTPAAMATMPPAKPVSAR